MRESRFKQIRKRRLLFFEVFTNYIIRFCRFMFFTLAYSKLLRVSDSKTHYLYV